MDLYMCITATAFVALGSTFYMSKYREISRRKQLRKKVCWLLVDEITFARANKLLSFRMEFTIGGDLICYPPQ